MKTKLKKSRYQSGGVLDLDTLMQRSNTSVTPRPIQTLSDSLLTLQQQNANAVFGAPTYPHSPDINVNKAGAMLQIAEGHPDRIKDYYKVAIGANPEKLSKRRKTGYGDRFREHQTGGDLISQLGYRNDSPFKNAPQLNINSPNISMENVDTPLYGISNQTGETKLMKPNKKYKFKNTSSVTEIPAYQKGGPMIDLALAGLQSTVAGSANLKQNIDSGEFKKKNLFGKYADIMGATPMGMITNPILQPLSQLFAAPDKTVVSGSPGSYQAGGDIPLSDNAFQVQGNPNTTDGNHYPTLNANLDHNEVVTNTQDGQKFVFSADLKDPQTGKPFADLASKQERAKGKAEKALKANPYDEQAKSTVSMSNANLNHISSIQEAVATALGHRNMDGSTVQNAQMGGRINNYQSAGYIDLGNKYYYDPQKNIYLNRATSGGYSVVEPNNYVRGLKQTYDTRNAPYNPNFIIDRQTNGLNPSPRNTPVTTTAPVAPKKAGTGKASKPDKTITSGKLDWLKAAQNFNINNPDPNAEQIAAENSVGGLKMLNTPSTPLTADQRAAIADPAFGTRQAEYTTENITNTPMSNLDANRVPLSTPNEASEYKTPWTFGDTLKGVELIGKSIGAFDKPEVDKPLIDRTQITKEAYDPTNALYQTNRTYNLYKNSLNTPSINLNRALSNSALAGKYSQDNQTLSQYDAMNKGAQTQYQQRAGQQAQFNVQSQFRTNDINAANRAAQDAVQQNFYSSVGQFGEDLNRKKYAADIINLYRNQVPDVFDSYIKSLMKTNGQ